MTWLSFSDDYTRQKIWDGMPYEARWAYHCLVEHLCETRRYDGRTSWANAIRCSDVPEPAECLKALLVAGLVTGNEGDHVAVPDIESFLPPDGLRPENLLPRKRRNQRNWRLAQCQAGKHTRDCPAGTCPVKQARRDALVTGYVAGNAGSGRVGQGETQTPVQREGWRGPGTAGGEQ